MIAPALRFDNVHTPVRPGGARSSASEQDLAGVNRSDEIDSSNRCNRPAVVVTAGVRESGVGQGEEDAAVAEAVAVGHLRPRFEAHMGEPVPYLVALYAKKMGIAVTGKHLARD